MKTENENQNHKSRPWFWTIIRLVARAWAKAARVNRDVVAEMDEEYRKNWGNFKGKGLL